VNASNYTVGCSLQGNIVFNPPLNKFGGQAEKAKFTANLSNCVARPTPGGPPVTISKGTISGTLAYKDNSCTFLVISASSESFVGNLTVRWASSPALSSPTSVLAVKTEDVVDGNTTIYTIPGPTASHVSGSFTGGNKGVTSVVKLVSGQTQDQMGLACGGSGLQSMPIAGGFVDLGAPPTSLAVSPSTATMVVGGGVCDPTCFTAVGTYEGGNQVDITAASKWASSNTAVATVQGATFQGAQGTIVVPNAKAAGKTTISASFGRAKGSAALTVVNQLNVTNSSLPDDAAGTPYDAKLTATGGTTPYTWSVAFGSLPNGLTLNPSTGEITGTPTDSTGTSFTIQVSDSSPSPQFSSANLSIGPPLSVATSSLPNGTVGSSYSQSLAAAGGVSPYFWSLASGSLPTGVSLDQSGLISGTPTAAGDYSFVVHVDDSSSPGKSATRSLSIHVS
jgi:hypothetical protein